MAFRLKSKENLSAGIKRIAAREVKTICEELKGLRRDAHAIHNVRTAVKRLRAVLRLIREGMKGKRYRREQRVLRALAHSLSTTRDVEARIKTLQKLQRRYHNAPTRELTEIQKTLEQIREQELRKLMASEQVSPKQAGRLWRSVKHWPLRRLRCSDLQSGLKRAYEHFVQARERATAEASDGNLHAWRRRVKNLAYEVALLKKVGPKGLGLLFRKLKELGEHLGNDHDLTLLGRGIAHPSKELKNFVRLRRAECQAAAVATSGPVEIYATRLAGEWRR